MIHKIEYKLLKKMAQPPVLFAGTIKFAIQIHLFVEVDNNQ